MDYEINKNQQNQAKVQRVIEESVPGKQVTLAHIIANPVPELYDCLGLDERGAVGILTLSPFETAMIVGDYAVKVADVKIGFLDRFTGSLVIVGDVNSVETALEKINELLENMLGYTVPKVTKT